MEPTRARPRKRRLLIVLLALSLALFLLWLALPRLLGAAAERWLNVPGLKNLQVDIAHLGSNHAHLRELRAVYVSGGNRLQFALHDIDLDYSLTDRHLEQLHIARGELAVDHETSAAPSPWPILQIPQWPLSEVRVDQLHVSIQTPTLAKVETQGSARLAQENGLVQLEFNPGDDRLRITAKPPKNPAERFEIHADWKAANGQSANAQLLIGGEPDKQPAILSVRLPLSLLLLLGQVQHPGLALPLRDARGELTLTASAQLGPNAGETQSIRGEATLSEAGAQIITTSTPMDLALNGKLHFAWQGSSSQLALQPGLRWQVASLAQPALQAGGQLEKPLTVRLDAGRAASEGDLPFRLSSPQWGQWSGSLQRLQLQRDNEDSAWRTLDAKLHFSGQLKTWQQGALQMRDLRTTGEATLGWSPIAGLNADLTAQTSVGRLSRSGDSPLSIANSEWQLKTRANAKTGDAFWSSLTVQGEAASQKLKIELTAGPAFTLGATRIQLSPWRAGSPAASKIEALLSAKGIHYGTWPAPDLNARLRIEGGKLFADGNLLLQNTEVLRFSGSQTLANACGVADLSLQQTLPTLSKLWQPRPPGLLPLDLPAGEVDARFALNWCAQPTPRLDANGTLQLHNATLGWDKARADTVQATLTLDGLQPLHGRVQLAAARGELATGTRLADLNLNFALAPQALSVQAFDLKLLGGALHSDSVQLPWPLDEQTVPLQLRQIDLGQLLALLKVDGLSGSGQLDGVLPLTYRDGSLEIDNGLLSSPGIGTLKYAPEQTIPDNPGLQALRNFHFQQLRAHISYASNGAYRTQIKLEGNNPDFYSGYPIRFGLNVNGELPGLFRSAVFSGDFNRHILEQLQSGKLQ